MRRVLVTGGLGFIGSAVVRHLVTTTDHEVLNLDVVSYSSTFTALGGVQDAPNYTFAQVDLADGAAVEKVVREFDPAWILHLAAESHVDRSIDGPRAFVDSNIVGTFNLLEAARRLEGLDRFLQVSTDEVFGSLPLDGGRFDEATAYDPRSPYSATKAAADHLARAWHETYGVPVVVTNCSNNYGPYQFPEKLIPLITIRAARGERLPVYGSGRNVRDWLHVDDHVAGLLLAAERGRVGESYNLGGGGERSNLSMVEAICDAVDARLGTDDRRRLIEHVTDRPGHDLRYAIDPTRAATELGWTPANDLATGLPATVDWYLDNEWWWAPLLTERGAVDRVGLGSGPPAGPTVADEPTGPGVAS